MRKEKRRRTQRQTPRFEVGRAGKGGRDVLMALLGLGWGNATQRLSLARPGPCPLLMGGWLPPWGWKGRAALSPALVVKGHLCRAFAEGAQPAFGVQAAVRRRPHPLCMVHSFPSLGISLNLYSDGFNAFQKREGGLAQPSVDFPRPHPWGPLGRVVGGLPSRPRPTARLDPFCEETPRSSESSSPGGEGHPYLFIPSCWCGSGHAGLVPPVLDDQPYRRLTEATAWGAPLAWNLQL